jgi:hypothetical protein
VDKCNQIDQKTNTDAEYYIPVQKYLTLQLRNKHNQLDTHTHTHSLPTSRDQSASTNAHNSHQICVRVVPPEDGQVIPETCRDFET